MLYLLDEPEAALSPTGRARGQHTRAFLDAPERFLRTLPADD